MKREPKLPKVYASFTDVQRKGRGAIPDLPEVWWVNGHGVAHTVRSAAVFIPENATAKGAGKFTFRPVDSRATVSISSNAPALMRTWRDLSKAGYIPTTKANYQATLSRLRDGEQPLRERLAA